MKFNLPQGIEYFHIDQYEKYANPLHNLDYYIILYFIENSAMLAQIFVSATYSNVLFCISRFKVAYYLIRVAAKPNIKSK